MVNRTTSQPFFLIFPSPESMRIQQVAPLVDDGESSAIPAAGPGTSKEPQVFWLGFDLFLSGLEVFVVCFDVSVSVGTGSVPPPPRCRSASSCVC